MTVDYKGRIGNLIRDARKHRGLTQQQLAGLLNTSQSAINRIEKGHQNLSLEMLARIGTALDSEIVALGGGPTHLRVTGPTRLSGSIDVKTSKNAGVALLCASLLNRGRTTLRKVARIEEVNRLLEVLGSLGVQTRWLGDDGDLEIIPPAELDLDHIDETAARRTRSVIMFLGPLLHRAGTFELPTPAAATSAPAPSSRTWPPCGRSAWRSRPPTGGTTRTSTAPSSPARPSFSPSAVTP
jgi:UDP-N-acetylglucosamine 1-carboxyvinyltransferase